MKRSFGGVLCLVLGTVLLVTGLRSGASGDVGIVPSPCSGGVVGVAATCPTGTISITETTQVTGTPVPTPPANWTVHVTSTCDDPLTGNPVAQDVTVPNNGTGGSTALFVFDTTAHNSSCSYALTETGAPAGYTPTFTPTSPLTIPWDQSNSGSTRSVALVNALVVATPTPSPTLTPTRTATATATPTATATATATAEPTSDAPSSAAAVANTGPHEQVRATAWIGGALCVLGLVLLLAGRRRPRGLRE
jgi:hypothetical protein